MTPFERLPCELILHLLSYLSVTDMLRVSGVNKSARATLQSLLPEILRLYPMAARSMLYRHMRNTRFLDGADQPRVLLTLPPGFHHAHAVTLPTTVLKRQDALDAIYEAMMLENCHVAELFRTYGGFLPCASDIARLLHAEKGYILQPLMEHFYYTHSVVWDEVSRFVQWPRLSTSCMKWMYTMCGWIRNHQPWNFDAFKCMLADGITRRDCVASLMQFRNWDPLLGMFTITDVLRHGAVNILRYLCDDRFGKQVQAQRIITKVSRSPDMDLPGKGPPKVAIRTEMVAVSVSLKDMLNAHKCVTYGTRALLEALDIVPVKYPRIDPLCATNIETMVWWYAEYARAGLCTTYPLADPIATVREAVWCHQFDRVSAIIRLSNLNPERDPTVPPIMLTGLGDMEGWFNQEHLSKTRQTLRTYHGLVWMRRYTDIPDETLLYYMDSSCYDNVFDVSLTNLYRAMIEQNAQDVVALFLEHGRLKPAVDPFLLRQCVNCDRMEIFQQLRPHYSARVIVDFGLWPEHCGRVHALILEQYADVDPESIDPILPSDIHGYTVDDLKRIMAVLAPRHMPTGQTLLSYALNEDQAASLELIQWIMATYRLDRTDIPKKLTSADFDCIDWFIREHRVVLYTRDTIYTRCRLEHIEDKSDLLILNPYIE